MEAASELTVVAPTVAVAVILGVVEVEVEHITAAVSSIDKILSGRCC